VYSFLPPSPFGRWSIESCFHESKDELGMDHYQGRGWRCLHRHFYVTQLSQLFCARIRQEYDSPSDKQLDQLTIEQVRRAANAWLSAASLSRSARGEQLEDELRKQQYHRRRNKQARESHTKTRMAKLAELGIDVDKITSCIPKPST